MVMKKASGGDSPLRQGARKSFWTLPISRRRRQQLVVCFLEKSLGLRVFPSRGLTRRKGDIRGWTRRSHPLVAWTRRSHPLVAWPGAGPCHHRVWLAPGPSPALLWTPSSCQVIMDFSFCFIQFREYFMCNFSETQKQQETGNWHCGILLISYFRKMHKNATKCKQNTKQMIHKQAWSIKNYRYV
jgi:hypothetical protein